MTQKSISGLSTDQAMPRKEPWYRSLKSVFTKPRSTVSAYPYRSLIFCTSCFTFISYRRPHHHTSALGLTCYETLFTEGEFSVHLQIFAPESLRGQPCTIMGIVAANPLDIGPIIAQIPGIALLNPGIPFRIFNTYSALAVVPI